MKFSEIKVDYYDNTASYVKYIMKLLEKEDTLENIIVKEIYNGILNTYDDEKAKDTINKNAMLYGLLENKILSINGKEKIKLLDELYNGFIKGMFHNYANGDLDSVKYFFDRMQERVIEVTGSGKIFENMEFFNSKTF